jgi:predicted transcriptional regulator of viral defense system
VTVLFNIFGDFMRFAEKLAKKVEGDIFSDTLAKTLINRGTHSRYGLVKRALKSGDIVRLKRGVYVFGEKYRKSGINLFHAAQVLYGPSCISLESALSYHDWIPEAVYTVTSASMKRSVEFKTPLGNFSYSRVLYKNFFTGVDRVIDGNAVFLIASPWRALADYVYVNNLDWDGLTPVQGSLRVDPDFFLETDRGCLEELMQSAVSKRVKTFIRGCGEELFA